MPHFSASTIILLIIAALLLFGPSRLPELGRAVGRTFREFKNGTKDLMEDNAAEAASQPRKEIKAEEVRNPELKAPSVTEVRSET